MSHPTDEEIMQMGDAWFRATDCAHEEVAVDEARETRFKGARACPVVCKLCGVVGYMGWDLPDEYATRTIHYPIQSGRTMRRGAEQ